MLPRRLAIRCAFPALASRNGNALRPARKK
jgi:hypothetical protein